jgi:hypothetical protein
MSGRALCLAILLLPLLSACTDRPSGFAPIVEKPPMAVDSDRGTVFDSDTLPNIYGMKWHHRI